MAASLLSRVHTFDSLRIRDYRLLWMGQLGTTMGQWMDQVTRGWLIYELTGSALQLGFAMAARGLPLLFFGIIGGAVADRYGRKPQLVIAQVTNAALNLLLATLVLTRHVLPWHVYVTGFLAGTVQAFQQPARQALVGDLVERRHLLNALALNSAALQLSRSIGPALAGLLIAVGDVSTSYYFQAGVYLFATLWTAQIAVPVQSLQPAHREREPFLSSIREGLSYAAHDRPIRTLLILALGPLALGMPYSTLMPIFAHDVLHGGAQLQGLLLAAAGVGALLGALYVASIRRRQGHGWVVTAGALAFLLAIAVFSQSRWVPVSLLLGVLIGVFSTTYQTQNQTLLQVMAPN
ncbi:MAG: MFS transporter, partial [Chloroflexi bacterium]|nr:MFS transporter [Chloroflexota bacterium]